MEKIARICWNTNNWERPSGKEGKSKNDNSYEKIVSYGHEEWLLDDSRIMSDGYHYGFLQAMNVGSGKHIGQTYDIHLFTISPTKQKIYIGCLHNAIGVDRKEGEAVYEHYKNRGWIKEMEEEVRFVGGKPNDFKPQFLFNVKFKFSEAEIFRSNQPILKPDSIFHRYKLMEKKADFQFLLDKENKIKTLDTTSIVRTNKFGETLIDPRHKKIQNAVVELLKDQYINLCLEKGEESLTSGQRVDIKGIYKKTNEWHYFEVKTSSAKQSIREALGQILEYSFYDNKSARATKLYIVGPEKPNEKDIDYIKKLREMYNLPIWFRWFSFEDNKLYDEI